MFSNLLAPLQETFADARDGNGDGGKPFRTILVQPTNLKFENFKVFEQSKIYMLKYVHIYRK